MPTAEAMFADGPPCLQHLAANGFPRGSRNQALLMVGIYAKRRWPGDWQQKLRELVSMLGPTDGLRCLDLGSDNGVVSLLLRRRGGTWSSADLTEEAQRTMADPGERGGVADQRLRLVLLCAHPALPPEAAAALTRSA